jgi:hypothetical protein
VPDADVIAQVVGPSGALVLAVIGGTAGITALWRQHREDDKTRIAANMQIVAAKDADVAFERARTREAEQRLDDLGETLKVATDVMEKSVLTTEKVVELLREPRPTGRR